MFRKKTHNKLFPAAKGKNFSKTSIDKINMAANLAIIENIIALFNRSYPHNVVKLNSGYIVEQRNFLALVHDILHMCTRFIFPFDFKVGNLQIIYNNGQMPVKFYNLLMHGVKTQLFKRKRTFPKLSFERP